MRHHIVTRIVISLVVLWTAAIVVFAWGTTRSASPPSGAPVAPAEPSGKDLFARHCAMCHDAAGVGSDWREAPDREAAAAAFRSFLVDHYGPSPEGIAAIVEYVMEPRQRGACRDHDVIADN
jgi:mono/diheme cytochrome c family protein